jgi:RsiW-degrading membrane proteinase PrsW (M82 family)
VAHYFTILISLLGGVLPALFWLWFWLKEDKRQPEPKSRIALSFICGMLAVWPAIEIERFLCGVINPGMCTGAVMPSFLLITLWASTEEILKYIFTFFSSFWKNKHNDEPLDPIIYLITAALGFSALENTFFLFNVIDINTITQSIVVGNSRFLGATLLHTASSAAIGVMMGLSYYKKPKTKIFFLFTGILISIALHTVFNLLIINLKKDLFFIFAGVWILIILLIVIIEKIKKIKS